MKIITDTGSDILEIEAKAMGVDLVPISANFEELIMGQCWRRKCADMKRYISWIPCRHPYPCGFWWSMP